MAAAAVAFVALRPGPRPQVTRFQIHAPTGSTLPLGTPAISPDGRTIAYTMTDAQGVTRIHVRPSIASTLACFPEPKTPYIPSGSPTAGHWIRHNPRQLFEAGRCGRWITPNTLLRAWPLARDGEPGWHTARDSGRRHLRWNNGEKPVLVARPEGEPAGAFPFFLPDGQRYLILANSNEGHRYSWRASVLHGEPASWTP
jgi:hypothetical protein